MEGGRTMLKVSEEEMDMIKWVFRRIHLAEVEGMEYRIYGSLENV